MFLKIKIFILLIITFLLSFVSSDSKEIEEYNAKALFIYNFTKYVEWNNIDLIEDFKITVYKSSSILSPLKELSYNRKVENKKINISEIRNFPENPNFQILFIPEKTPIELCNTLKNNSKYKNVLIISENSKHFNHFSILNFIISENKIKFEINIERAESANLKISSQLLKLAINIKKT